LFLNFFKSAITNDVIALWALPATAHFLLASRASRVVGTPAVLLSRDECHLRMSQDEARFSRRDWARALVALRLLLITAAVEDHQQSGSSIARWRMRLVATSKRECVQRCTRQRAAPQAVCFLLVLNPSEEAVDPERRVRRLLAALNAAATFWTGVPIE
jgi:hypothetical protein